jgi:RES domain-containing protein
LLYTAASLALAVLEVLVHLEDEEVLADYSYASVQFDEAVVMPVEKIAQLPLDWREFPVPNAVRRIGNEWVRSGSSAVLRVPTAILPREFNYIINLEHEDARGIEYGSVERFVFDRRFVERRPKK